MAGLFRGQNQPVDQVTAAALLKYGQSIPFRVTPYLQPRLVNKLSDWGLTTQIDTRIYHYREKVS